MRKQRLLIWMTCLLLGAVSGCNNKPKILQGKHHSPVSGDIGSDGKASSCRPTVPVSVLVDEGGTVSPSGTLTIEPPATATSSAELFDIESKLNGTPTPVCANEASTITTTLPFTCTVVNQDGDYTITVTVHTKTHNGTTPPISPPPPFTAYVRSCKNC